MIKDTKLRLCILIGLWIILLSSCDRNHPPIITELMANPTSVEPEDESTLIVRVEDIDGDPITCKWSATGGRFLDSEGTTAIWMAPVYSGTYKIEVIARDPQGAADTASTNIRVTQVTKTIIDRSYRVAPNDWRYEKVSLREDYIVDGYFRVSTHDINFFIFDEVNYWKWVAGETCECIEKFSRSSYASFSFVVPKTDNYYFVMDNTYSILTSKDVYVYATSTTP